MKIFSFLGHDTLEREWTYAAQGSIWRILFSTSGNVVGECRQHEQKTVSFFCLDERSGAVLWQDVRLDEPWWVGIEAVSRDVVLLHEFANPGVPEHKGIIALDVGSGSVLWRNTELTFWFAFNDSVYAYQPKFEKRIGYKLSLRAGAVEEEYGDALDDLYALRTLALNEQQQEDFLFPEILEEDPGNAEIQAIIRKGTKGTPLHGQVEFIRRQSLVLMNYYTPGRSSTPESLVLENRFSIYDLERQSKVFSEILATDAKAPTPDSFFIKGSLVYFIKQHNILTALRLTEKNS